MELSTLVIAFITILSSIALYLKHKRDYWKRKGVPFVQPQFGFGILQRILNPKRAVFEIIEDHYNSLKKAGHKHGGIYLASTPFYLAIDPDLIRNILSKDFTFFQDRGAYYDEKNDPLSAHLFSLEGTKWRNLRVKLTPTFTSGKMKMMFPTLLDCGDQMMEKIDEMSANHEAVDSKELLACFTTDVIGSCAFGLECNSFKDRSSAFRDHGRNIFKPSWNKRMRLLIRTASPRLARMLKVPVFDRNLTKFYMSVVKKVVKYREENSVVRNDFMQILLELKNNEENGLTIEEIAAQAFVFFLAGFETSSTLMNFCLFELTRNEEIQRRTREDILDCLGKHGGKFTYESVMDMKYLGQVIDETLRKYPPAPTLIRQCVSNYKIPNTDIVLDKGTRTVISLSGLHYDPEHYPDPEKFDPDRFSDENKAKRHPFTYLPFGEGPRICIALRFGLLQSRVGLALILKNYMVKLNSKTVLPLEQNPSSFLLQPLNNIYLEMEKL